MTEPLTALELRALYERYAPVVHRRAGGLLRDDSEAWDVVHEVFERLLRQGDAFRREAQPLTWIYRVTTNLCLNRLRAARVRQERPAPEEARAGPAEERDLLRALAARLDDRALQIAALHLFDGLTQEEIGQVVGLSRKTVGRELERIRLLAVELGGDPSPSPSPGGEGGEIPQAETSPPRSGRGQGRGDA